MILFWFGWWIGLLLGAAGSHAGPAPRWVFIIVSLTVIVLAVGALHENAL